MFYLCFFLLILIVLIEVSFFTLFERSILGYMQFRSGPNSLGWGGFIQPFGDAISLFGKESAQPLVSNYSMYLLSPILGIFLSFCFWLLYPFFFQLGTFLFGVLIFICISSIGIYPLLVSGWASNSVYGLLGGVRGVAQTISYEVNMVMVLLSVLFLTGSFNFVDLGLNQEYVWFGFFLFPLICVFLSALFAEVNRAPFDFAEGESELVSGFNVEYSGLGFSFIFMGEYSSMLFMGVVLVIVFGGGQVDSFFCFLGLVFFMFLFIWVRGSFPRYRYDKLMDLAWSVYLPVTLNVFFLVLVFNYLLLIFILLSKANKSI